LDFANFASDFVFHKNMREDNLKGSTIDALAARQLADYDQRRPGTLFADGVELTIDQGYALQSAVTELRQKRGEKVVGYKVGCTSPTIRSQLGIDHCIMGSLFDSEQHPSGAILSGDSYSHLACEGELAIELSRQPSLTDFQSDGIPGCVSRVFPVIELHQYVTRAKSPNAAELIANNAIHAGVVAGSGIKVPFQTGSYLTFDLS
jgi:2-keto-4-pentenoate hydratase